MRCLRYFLTGNDTWQKRLIQNRFPSLISSSTLISYIQLGLQEVEIQTCQHLTSAARFI